MTHPGLPHETVIHTVLDVTADVFSTMLGMDVIPGEPQEVRNQPGPSNGIITVIGFAGTWIGTGSICCTAETACRIAGSMLMAEFAEINDEVLDAMAEITNMVFGNFKTQAEVFLGPLGLTIPTVIYGLNFQARTADKEKWTIVPYSMGDETFEIRVCLTPNRGFTHFMTVSHAAGPAS